VDAKEQAMRALKKLLGKFQERQEIYFALTGDGTGASTADVEGRTNWTWVRYDEEQSKVSQVYNPRLPGLPEEVPVIIGRKFPTDRHAQILGINEPLYGSDFDSETVQGYLVPLHGHTHNASGRDPALIDMGNIVPGLTHQPETAGSEVRVEAFRYMYKTALAEFGGEDVDLSAVTPSTDRHQYVLISLIPSTGALRTTQSGEYPLPAVPTVPTVTPGDIPLAVVDIIDGENIENKNIYDYRVLFQDAGNSLLESLRHSAHLAADMDMLISRHVVEG